MSLFKLAKQQLRPISFVNATERDIAHYVRQFRNWILTLGYTL